MDMRIPAANWIDPSCEHRSGLRLAVVITPLGISDRWSRHWIRSAITFYSDLCSVQLAVIMPVN